MASRAAWKTQDLLEAFALHAPSASGLTKVPEQKLRQQSREQIWRRIDFPVTGNQTSNLCLGNTDSTVSDAMISEG